MSDHEDDPYYVSSDDEDVKGPPKKIQIEGCTTDLKQLKDSLVVKDENVRDENTLKEIEELRQTKGQELKAMKADFEAGKVTTAEKGQAGTEITEELSQIRSLKEKKADWESSVAEAQAEKKGQPAADEEKLKELESLSTQVSGVKNKWKTGDVEKAEERDDAAKREELEALKNAGVKVKERFQPPTASEVQKSYDASELLGSGASDARKSFLEGSAFAGSAAEKTQIEQLDVQLRDLKQAFEKPESEMTVEERAEKKKREIEEEFLRYKMARQLRSQQGVGKEEEGVKNGGGGLDALADNDEATIDVRSLMDKFKNIEDLAPKQIASKLDELEQLRVEASALRQRFEKSGDFSELSEEKKRQLEEEFAALREERERAKRERQEEDALAAASQAEKEEIQVAADHAQKMTAKWEKIHAKEAKKAEKSKMPQKVSDK